MSEEEHSFGSLMTYDPDSEALTLLMFRINSLIRERDEMKEQRDEWGNLWADLARACVKDLTKVEREVVTLTEQRDRLAQALENCREDSIELLGERDWWQLENRCDYQQRYQDTRDNVTNADAALQSLIKP